MIVNVNLGLGGVIKEAQNFVSAAVSTVQDMVREEAAAKRLRAPHDNATFAAAVADAVYCITTDDKTPHGFVCCPKIMPNQFSIPFTSCYPNMSSDASEKRHKFELHQWIMQDALSKHFERVLIVEPGVELTHFVDPARVSQNIPINDFIVLGGALSLAEDFYSTSHPLLQYGHANRIDAFVVNKRFMQKMVVVDQTLLNKSTDEFYHECPLSLCMVPEPFENKQLSTTSKICTQFNNTFRSFSKYSIRTIWLFVFYLFLVLWLIALIL